MTNVLMLQKALKSQQHRTEPNKGTHTEAMLVPMWFLAAHVLITPSPVAPLQFIFLAGYLGFVGCF